MEQLPFFTIVPGEVALYGMHYVIDYFRVFGEYTNKFGWIPPKIKEINEEFRIVKVFNSNTW